MGIFLSFMKGCLTKKLVLKPSFSAFAIASSVVPVLLHCRLNSINFLSSKKSLHIGCSAETAMKLAPKIVSGLVVKTLIFSFLFSISKSISHP